MTEIGAFFQDFILWIFGGIATILGSALGVVRGNRERSMNNKRQLQGDPDDPNTEGVLQIAKENKQLAEDNGNKIDRLEDKMENQHEQVLSRVEELARDRRDADAD